MEESLKRLLKNSYSPYSGFRVAAICLMKDGKSFGGVNIENASYGATTCAEKVAILKAVSEGYRKGDIKCLYVMTNSNQITPSCFLCRQMISEFFEPDNEVIFMNKNKEEKRYLVKDICPLPFDNNYLK